MVWTLLMRYPHHFLVGILTITIPTLECYGCRRERHKSIFRVEKYTISSKQPLFLSTHIASLYVDLTFANNYLNCIPLSLCYSLYGKPSYLKIKPLFLIHEWWMSVLAVWPPQPKTAYRFDIRPYGVNAPDEISSPFLVGILTITIPTLACYGCGRERSKR